MPKPAAGDILGYTHKPQSPVFLDINYYHRTKQWTIQKHSHAYFQFLVVISGSLAVTAAGEERVLTAGCASLIPPGVEHTLFSSTGYEQIGAGLRVDSPSGLTALLREQIRGPVVAENVPLIRQCEALVPLLANGSTLALTRAEALLTQSLLDIVENLMNDGRERFDRELSDYLTQRLDQRLTLEEIASHFHISPSHLERLTRQHFGMGVIALFNRRRAGHAGVLLRMSGLRISEIAQQVGFSEVSNFSAFFAKYMGLPPSQYRRQNRSE